MNTPTHGQNPPENQPVSFEAKIYDIIKAGFENKESRHEIFNRESLSFTVKNQDNPLVNWYIPPKRRNEYYEDGLKIGAGYFNEVRNLALHNPLEAYHSLRFVWLRMNQAGYGEEQGFMNEFAKAALVGILAYQNGIPDLSNSEIENGG